MAEFTGKKGKHGKNEIFSNHDGDRMGKWWAAPR